MNIGKNLVTLRKAKTLTQEDLAEELKVSRQAISKWELGTSRPDIDNIIKLSELFSISIDELVNNEIVKTEAISIDVKPNDKKHEILVWVRRLIIVAIVLFIVNVIYKFVVLFKITSVESQYKELNNYHYVITTYKDIDTYEEEECWFKDGVSKTILTKYDGNVKDKKITYIDYNNSIGYEENNDSSRKIPINVKEHLEFNKDYEKGRQLYSRFPLDINEQKISKMFSKSISTDLNIRNNDKNVFLLLNDDYINLSSDTLLPIMCCYKNEEDEDFYTRKYIIELNSVEDIKI